MDQYPVMENYRQQIAALDLAILEAVNARIQLVRRLKEHKDAQGLSFFDPAQEDRLMANLAQANPGPLSQEGLRAVFAIILAWAKHDATGSA